MIYVVKFKDGKTGNIRQEEVEATSFKFDGPALVFIKETPMSGIVGTGKEVKSVAAYANFISVRETLLEKSK